MQDIAIEVSGLQKTYQSFKKSETFLASLKDFFKRQKISTQAVKPTTFTIKEGEFVGLLGMNGAGKTTLIKMLTGILTPSGGSARVLGFSPWKRQNAYKKQMALVMGQKNQLWWDLPPIDSYELFRVMYEIPRKRYEKNLKELSQLLEMEELIKVPTRKMSLGQRMKAELIGALLHDPKVLFLDEPTIGLDLISQRNIRDFLKKYNKEKGATVILTSHYMEDIKELCERVIIIDKGSLIFDNSYEKLTEKYVTEKKVTMSFSKKVNKEKLQKFGEIQDYDEKSASIDIPRQGSQNVLAGMMHELPIEDLNVSEASMEDIVSDIFTRGLKK